MKNSILERKFRTRNDLFRQNGYLRSRFRFDLLICPAKAIASIKYGSDKLYKQRTLLPGSSPISKTIAYVCEITRLLDRYAAGIDCATTVATMRSSDYACIFPPQQTKRRFVPETLPEKKQSQRLRRRKHGRRIVRRFLIQLSVTYRQVDVSQFPGKRSILATGVIGS